MQIYQLQTENDEEETWRDLVRALISATFIFSSHSLRSVNAIELLLRPTIPCILFTSSRI